MYISRHSHWHSAALEGQTAGNGIGDVEHETLEPGDGDTAFWSRDSSGGSHLEGCSHLALLLIINISMLEFSHGSNF